MTPNRCPRCGHVEHVNRDCKHYAFVDGGFGPCHCDYEDEVDRTAERYDVSPQRAREIVERRETFAWLPTEAQVLRFGA